MVRKADFSSHPKSATLIFDRRCIMVDFSDVKGGELLCSCGHKAKVQKDGVDDSPYLTIQGHWNLHPKDMIEDPIVVSELLLAAVRLGLAAIFPKSAFSGLWSDLAKRGPATFHSSERALSPSRT